MAVAAAGDPKDAYTVGKVTALEARAAGVHWIFAPDADVNDNPDNPIINMRSFGEDPQSVAEICLGIRARRGGKRRTRDRETFSRPWRRERGFASDARDGAGRSRAISKRVELVPFRAAIAAGVGSGHDRASGRSGVRARSGIARDAVAALLTDLLRNELDFDGLVVTDALDMGGVTRLYARRSSRPSHARGRGRAVAAAGRPTRHSRRLKQAAKIRAIADRADR